MWWTNVLDRSKATIETASKIGGRAFWTRLEDEIERQADPRLELSPEKKQKLLAQIRTISDRWRPFILELVSTADANQPAKRSN